MDYSLFDHIYVINLQRSADRRDHITKEFQRVEIPDSQWSFFPATDSSDPVVRNILNKRGVQKFPDGSSRRWRHLNKNQIANWCSYIRVWADIIEKGYDICMICEDDIKFADYYRPVCQQAFNYEYLLQQGVDPARPLLIGVGSGWQDFVHRPGPTKLVQHNPIGARECNPCHIINGLMAEELLRNSSVVDRASDPYIHNLIGARHQRYWIVPQPVYELSWNPKVKKFSSTIEGHFTKGEKLR